jgi:hypothetical protein
MDRATTKKRWSAEQRLEFIEFFSYWEGAINRSDLMDRFGVSAPQASADLTTYQQIAPDNLRYDLSSKRYVASEQFQFKLVIPDADRYLKQLTAVTGGSVSKTDTWLGETPVADVIPIPTRRVDPAVLRTVLAAIRGKHSIEIEYQSMRTAVPDSLWRRITPHALASDGFRWHIRAFCHKDHRFKDFLLSRCLGARQPGPAGASGAGDEQWNTFFDVELVPNPQLSSSQRKAIEFDYAMQDGKIKLSVRRALLYYFDKRLRSDIIAKQSYGSLGDPREVPIVVANLDAYIAELESVGVRALPEK